MKKILMMCVAGMMAGVAFGATWTDPETGITWTYTVSGGKASVGGGTEWFPAVPTSTTGAIVIPSVLGGCPVTSIGNYAFCYCSSLTSVTIPEGVTSIGERAFYYCRSLTSVTIPEGVTNIGDFAFYDCSSLTSVTIPEGVTSIGNSAFSYCSSLTSVTIPEGVTSIGNGAFSFCSSLTSVTIPEGVTSIGNAAFYSCSSLTSVTIPEGVTSIGERAFSSCISLTSVTIPGSVTSIGDHLFDGSPNMIRINYPDGFKPIKHEKNAYYNATTAERLVLRSLSTRVICTSMRKADPTIMDVTYEVTGNSETTDVRVLMFRETAGRWDCVVRPETFVEGTEAEIGDGIEVNVPHIFSWRVSADVQETIAKFCAMMIVRPGDLLPLRMMTVPAGEGHPAYRVSRNVPTDAQVMNALWWLYASHEPDLTLENGVLKSGGTVLARGTGFDSRENTRAYLYGKMGLRRMTDSAVRARVNGVTRLGLGSESAFEVVE